MWDRPLPRAGQRVRRRRSRHRPASPAVKARRTSPRHSPLHRGRGGGGACGSREPRGGPRRHRRARLPAGVGASRRAPAAPLRQGQARSRRHPNRVHRGRPQRLCRGTEIHQGPRHRPRNRRFRHRLGSCPRYRCRSPSCRAERGTIAVLAGGIDIVYPPENEELQRAIGERGPPHQRALPPASLRAPRIFRAATG
jgi:hypothetical protein